MVCPLHFSGPSSHFLYEYWAWDKRERWWKFLHTICCHWRNGQQMGCFYRSNLRLFRHKWQTCRKFFFACFSITQRHPAQSKKWFITKCLHTPFECPSWGNATARGFDFLRTRECKKCCVCGKHKNWVRNFEIIWMKLIGLSSKGFKSGFWLSFKFEDRIRLDEAYSIKEQ